MLFVGVKTGDGITYESFRAAETPTHETHGHRFGCVIGAEKLARTVGVDKSLPRTKHYPRA
jgi:hypothetical protein